MRSLGGCWRIGLVVTGLLAALLFGAVAGVPSPGPRHLLSNLAQAAIVLWAAGCAFRAARLSPPYFRQLWRLFGAALCLAAAGELLVAYWGGMLHLPRNTPWPSDVLLFTWVAPAAMMLLPWRADESAAARWERNLDFAQIAIVFVTAYLCFFYVPAVWEAHGMLMFNRLMQAAMARDVLLAAGFLLRGATLPRPGRTLFGRLAIIFLGLGLVEGIEMFRFQAGPRAASWIGASWALPFVFAAVLAAAWEAPQEAPPVPQASDQSVRVASQILPLSIPLLVLFMGGRIAREQLTFAALAVAAAFTCSGARFLLTSQRQRQIAEDLRRAEHAARQSQQMFSAAFVSSPDAISIAQLPEGTLLEVNESFTRLTGFSREEVQGKTPEGLGLWVDQEIMLEMRKRFRERGELLDEELRFRRKDGEIRYGRLSGALISADDRRYSMVQVRDITESKKAEDALRASEHRFRTLMETQRVGIAVWGADGRCRFVNRALMEMHGYTDIDPTGIAFQSVMGAVPAFDAEGREIPWNMLPSARVLETHQPVRNQVIGQMHPVTKKPFWRLVDAVPEFTPNGEFAGVISSSTDITDLKRAEEEKRISQEMFSKAFQASPDSMVITTLEEGRYLEVNEAFTRQYGWTREEAVGKTVTDLGIWPEESGRKPFKIGVLHAAPISQMEAVLRVKSGELRDVLISADVLHLNGQICVLSVTRDVTEKKRQEEALRASEQRSRTLLEALRVGVTTWGPDGRCRSVNQALLDITGMREEHYLGKTSMEFGTACDERGNEIPAPLRPAARALATRQPVRNQVLGLKPPGVKKPAWVLADAVPEFSPEGELVGAIASYTDITDLKNAEEQKRISEEMFAKAFHASPDSMEITTVEEGRYLEVNEAYTRQSGWEREEVIGRTVGELRVWPDPAEREKLTSQLLNRGAVSQFEACLRIKSGEIRDVLISADLIQLRGHTCILSVAHDITDRKKKEEALYASEERFRTLVQNIDAGILLFSPDGRVQFANEAAQKIFDLREEQVRGKLPTELPVVLLRPSGEVLPVSERPVARVLATGRPVDNIVIGWNRTGSAQASWLVCNAVPQFSKDGQISAVIVSMADITEQKKAEETLRRLSARLLQLQDEERRRLGRDLHDSLAQLVLAVNLRLAQVTQSAAGLDERSRRGLSEARGTLQEMSRQIRTLSYLLHPPLLDELGLASAIREYAQGFSERSAIAVAVDIQAEFPRLPQEAEMALFRIVQESLTNIQKHSGSPTASIRLSGDGGVVTLEVRDCGRGMPAVPERHSDPPGARFGVGILGMRERMTQLGGGLEIESNGTGTTVRAHIPVPVEAMHAVPNPGGR